ncbi:hypothetical protein V2P20_12920 [Methylobacter sp. Wu1]|uniref:hypothetical protein n=1 Tax=Methylobacter sp. Wu1 TaxID=3119359 RepID=UPI002F95F348
MTSDNPAVNFVEYMKGVGDSAVNIAEESAYGVYDFGQVAVGGAKIAAKEGLSAIGANEAAAKIMIEDIEPLSALGKAAAQGGYEGLGDAVKSMPGNMAHAVADAVRKGDMRALGGSVTDAVLMAEGARAGVVGAAKSAGKAGAALKPAVNAAAEAATEAAGKAKAALGKAKSLGNPENANSAVATCAKKNNVESRKANEQARTPRPSPDEINLAKSPGNSDAHIAARNKVAKDFLEKNGYSKEQIKEALGSSDGLIVGGVDLSKPVGIMSFPPPESMSQYVKSHGYPGNWFDPKGFQTPDSLGISGEGRKLVSFKMPEGQGLLSYSKPIIDTWTNPANPIKTSGGGQQLFVSDSIKNQVISINKIGG